MMPYDEFPNTTPPINMTNKSTTSSVTTQKRPVARRACLACREKKIKCDGEPPMPPGFQDPQVPKVCSNCKYLGIECVFVQSNRGGRRRKRTDSIGETSTTLSGAGKDFNKIPKSLSSSVRSPSIDVDLQTRNQLNFLHAKNKECSNVESSERRSPSLGSRSNASTSTYYRDQLPYRGEGEYRDPYGPPSPPSPPYHHRHHRHHHHHDFRRGGPPEGPPEGFFPGPLPPPPPFHRGPPGPPFGFGFPPPPPHHRFGYGPPPPGPPFHHRGPGGGGKRWRHMYDHYQLPPPQALLPSIGSNEQQQLQQKLQSDSHNTAASEFSEFRRSSTDSAGNMSIDNKKPSSEARGTATEAETGSLKFIDSVLANFDLPDRETCFQFFDLYYRYVHASIPILNSKLELIERFSPKTEAALLHCMFALVCQFAPPNVITRSDYRNHTYWISFVDKHWSHLSTTTSICALLLLFRYFSSLNDLPEARRCLARITDIDEVFELQHALRHRDSLFYEKMSTVSTKEQLSNRLQLIRLIWATWISGLIYKSLDNPQQQKQQQKQQQQQLMKFPLEMELPTTSYEDTPLNWKHIQSKSTEIQSSLCDLESSQFLVVVHYMVNEFGKLTTSIDHGDFNSKVDSLIKISDKKLYKITSLQSSSIILDKRIVVIDSNMLMSSLQLYSLRILNTLSLANKWFMFKPSNFANNSQGNDTFNDLSELSQILLRDSDLTNIQNFFSIFKSSLAIIKLLNLGYGIIEEDDSGTFPVVIGPTTYKSTADIKSSFMQSDSHKQQQLQQLQPWWHNFDNPHLITAIRDPDIPDSWLLYPFISSQVIAQNIYILLSIILICKFVLFDYCPENSSQLVVKFFQQPLSDEDQEQQKEPVKETKLDISTLDFVPLAEFSLHRLLNDLRLCYKFLNCQARYSVSVKNGLSQIEKIVGYIDEVLKSIG